MRNAILRFLTFWPLLLGTPVDAYEIPTHEEITRVAGERSTIDEILRTDWDWWLAWIRELTGRDWQTGSGEAGELRGRSSFGSLITFTIRSWIGHWLASKEHWPVVNSLGPEHDRVRLVMARRAQCLLRCADAAISRDRDSRLARTFEGVGRQAHLVQDAASPRTHADDPHVFYNYESLVNHVLKQENNAFEGWLAGALDASGAPDPGWRLLDSNLLAPIATARLMDTDRYHGRESDEYDGSADRPR